MTAKQYKQQLNSKWGSIQDAYTRTLIAQLLEYAQTLENQKSSLSNPKSIPYKVGPKGDEVCTQSFRNNIDFSFLPDNATQEESGAVNHLVEQLLAYAERLEQTP